MIGKKKFRDFQALCSKLPGCKVIFQMEYITLTGIMFILECVFAHNSLIVMPATMKLYQNFERMAP